MPQSEETQYPLFLHPEVTVVFSQKANGYTYATSIPYCTDSSVHTHSYCTEPPTEEKLSSVMQGISVCVCVCVKIGQTSSMVFDWYMVEGTFVFCKLLYCTSNFTLHYITTKPTPDTVHSPTPGQLHVESIQLACTCALCCCYALCMKREELLIFYSFWLRCFVVMMQYVGFLGRSQLFGSQVKVGAPTWQLARANSVCVLK